jgi:hypothetical protein
MTDLPDLPNFSRFHDAFRENSKAVSNEGHMRPAFFMAYDASNCEFVKLVSKEVDDRLKNGPEMISANFVIPYPPGFPIMVPGQVITEDTITFMRKLDVTEIHGYHVVQGIKPSARGAGCTRGSDKGRERLSLRASRDDACVLRVLRQNPYILLFFTVGMAVLSASFVTGWGWSPRRLSLARRCRRAPLWVQLRSMPSRSHSSITSSCTASAQSGPSFFNS